MTEFVRVKLEESGHEVTVSRVIAEAEGSGMKIIAGKATHADGRPLPAKPNMDLVEKRAKKTAAAKPDAAATTTGGSK